MLNNNQLLSFCAKSAWGDAVKCAQKRFFTSYWIFTDFLINAVRWDDCQRNRILRKRELLNKFAKCIGGRLRHLILSGLIFCRIKQVDENYFHIVSSQKSITRRRRGGVLRIDARRPYERSVIKKSVIASSKKRTWQQQKKLLRCTGPNRGLDSWRKPVIIMSGVPTQCPSSQKKIW